MAMSPLPPRAQRATLIAAVFYANLVSLAAQVIWVRKINLLFGATAGVFASVLAVVLAGLACGAAWGGRRAAAQPRPERWLAALLVVLGALCAAEPAAARRGARALPGAGARGPGARRRGRPCGCRSSRWSCCRRRFAIGAILPLATQLYGRISAGRRRGALRRRHAGRRGGRPDRRLRPRAAARPPRLDLAAGRRRAGGRRRSSGLSAAAKSSPSEAAATATAAAQRQEEGPAGTERGGRRRRKAAAGASSARERAAPCSPPSS